MTRLIALLCLWAISALGAAPSRSSSTVKKPKLVVTIIVDQFRYDYLTRFQSAYTSGISTLLSKGAVFTNAHYEHFPTVTAVGHSAVLSGAKPALSGIVGNEWYDYGTRKQVTSVSDQSVQLLGGTPGRRASSPHRLLVSTIGDELKLAQKGSNKVIGISIKDRAAILPAGRMADGAYWFDDVSGNFVSSTWYFKELPAWVAAFNTARTADKWVGQTWAPLDNPKAKPFRAMPAALGEKYFRSLERTPFGGELLEMFAETAIDAEKLGRHEITDVLAISFSSNDYVGHEVGPHDPQMKDMSIRTDRTIGRLFQFLDKQIGLGDVLVVMTADHGVAPLPEFMERNRMPGGRIATQTVADAVTKALTARYGEGGWISGRSDLGLYLNRELALEKKLELGEVEQTAARAIRDVPHIMRVYTREQLRLGQFAEDRVGVRVRNGFCDERAPDLFLIPEPYWIFGKTGTTHGLPFNYDSHVPLIIMGRGIQPGRYDHPVSVASLAPTLATLLDVETPSGAEERVLDEIFTVK